MYTIFDKEQDAEHGIDCRADLENLTNSALVEAYNELTGEDIGDVESYEWLMDELWALIQEVDNAPEVPVATGNTGRKSKINRLAVVRMSINHNPKRVGTQAHAHFSRYSDGMTVDELQKQGVPLGDIRWNMDKGHIYLEEPGEKLD